MKVYSVNEIIEKHGLNPKLMKKYENKSIEMDEKKYNELERKIQICKENEIEPTELIFSVILENLEEVIKVCQENNIKPYLEMSVRELDKMSKEIPNIIKICQENEIEITGKIFTARMQNVEDSVSLCKINDIPLRTEMFFRSKSDNQEIIDICLKNGISLKKKNYLIDKIFSLKIEHIKEIIKICEEYKINISTPTIFFLQKKDIFEKIKLLHEHNIELDSCLFTYNTEHLQKRINFLKENNIELCAGFLILSNELLQKKINSTIIDEEKLTLKQAMVGVKTDLVQIMAQNKVNQYLEQDNNEKSISVKN